MLLLLTNYVAFFYLRYSQTGGSYEKHC
jgi:hypothetical protein